MPGRSPSMMCLFQLSSTEAATSSRRACDVGPGEQGQEILQRILAVHPFVEDQPAAFLDFGSPAAERENLG